MIQTLQKSHILAEFVPLFKSLVEDDQVAFLKKL